MIRTLVKTARIELDGRFCDVRYFEQRTARGARRYSSELLIGGTDRIIVDDDSMTGLESKVDRLVPAALLSRALAAKPATAA